MYGLKTMAEILNYNNNISLTAASERASNAISTSFDTLYSPKTLRTHYQRLVNSPEFYNGSLPIFPSKLSNTASLNNDQELELVQLINKRIARKDLVYPNITTFLQICYEFCSYKYSQAWMSRFLKRHNFHYGTPQQGKIGTRYHDSEINIKDRISFLLKKIWFISWELVGQAKIYVHDESWINEKPSGIQHGLLKQLKLERKQKA